MNSSDSEDKTARYLLWAYCVFILYGCFIPFHFNFDPNFVRWRWVVFLTESLHEDIAGPSLSDIVSNILLFVPFGILSVWARTADRTDRAGFLAILYTTVYGLLFAFIIESGQTVAPGRDPSIRDAAAMGSVLSSAQLALPCCSEIIGNISKTNSSGFYSERRRCFCLPT
jgi:hypothetical protein